MKRSRNYVGTIKNNETGWDFIKSIKNVMKVRLRGRHSNRKEIAVAYGLHTNWHLDFPLYLADSIAIYKSKKKRA